MTGALLGLATLDSDESCVRGVRLPSSLRRGVPPLHDEHDRVAASSVGSLDGGWTAFAFGADDGRHAWLLRHGGWHLQLLHDERRVSLLTPSRLTGGAFEIFPIVDEPLRLLRYTDVVRLVEREHGVRPPPLEDVARAVRRLRRDAPQRQ